MNPEQQCPTSTGQRTIQSRFEQLCAGWRNKGGAKHPDGSISERDGCTEDRGYVDDGDDCNCW